MNALAWQLAKAGGWGRFVLLAGCTAIVSGLLLVAIAILRLGSNTYEAFFAVVADPGTRGGVVFAAVLLTVPPLLLLDQAVRLGTATRERRLAALRVAGATPGEARRIGAIEVGIPTCVGAGVGMAVYWLLRAVLGGTPGGRCEAFSYEEVCTSYGSSPGLGIVPTTVTPTWWQFVLVVVGVSALGAAVGYRASRSAIATPLAVTRRQTQSAPRPWGMLFFVAAAALIPLAMSNSHSTDYLVFVAIGLGILGIVGLSPWIAYRVGGVAQSRANSPAMLLASQRVVAEPGPAGRAAAAVGGIGMVAGGAAVILATVIGMGQVESEYVISLLLVAVGLLGGLVVVTGSIAVHTVESLLDRKREVAFLAATGTPESELERAQLIEAVLVTVPMALIGTVLGTLAVGFLNDSWTAGGVLVVVGSMLGTIGLVWGAAFLAVRMVRPWARRAALPANLRTE